MAMIHIHTDNLTKTKVIHPSGGALYLQQKIDQARQEHAKREQLRLNKIKELRLEKERQLQDLLNSVKINITPKK